MFSPAFQPPPIHFPHEFSDFFISFKADEKQNLPSSQIFSFFFSKCPGTNLFDALKYESSPVFRVWQALVNGIFDAGFLLQISFF